MSRDIIIGIDAGTSVIKSIAFDLAGRLVAASAVPNRYTAHAGGGVTQCLDQTWRDCVTSLVGLADKVPELAQRVAAISVTGQGDGTWLVGADDQPVGEGWLWLDARAGALAQSMRDRPEDRARFFATGTGVNACQQGAQLSYMKAHMPDQLSQAEVSFHCKDWLYLKLTGERVTDPSEACFSFGDYKTRTYSDDVVGFYDLGDTKRLLPPICDGTKTAHAITSRAAELTGLLAGTPVILGYVDVVCSVLGAGGYQPHRPVGCTIVGTTGVHIRAQSAQDITLNAEQRTGYVMVLPIDDIAGQLQTNMAGTLNLDWIKGLAGEMAGAIGVDLSEQEQIALMNKWMGAGKPGALIYHPYISDAGERGPFIDHTARSSFIGLSTETGFADMVRATAEGLGFAARDCYMSMGALPGEIRLTGGAARSQELRRILSATLGVPVRQSLRQEAGAAGAAMMAAVSVGCYADMDACIAAWVTPDLGACEEPDAPLARTYSQLFTQYTAARDAMQPIWHALAQQRNP